MRLQIFRRVEKVRQRHSSPLLSPLNLRPVTPREVMNSASQRAKIRLAPARQDFVPLRHYCKDFAAYLVDNACRHGGWGCRVQT